MCGAGARLAAAPSRPRSPFTFLTPALEQSVRPPAARQSLGFASLAADTAVAAQQWQSADKAAAEHKRQRKKDKTGGMTEAEIIAARRRTRAARRRDS